jgi:hypothetical protein
VNGQDTAAADALVRALHEFGRPLPEPTLRPELASLLTDEQLRQALDLLPPKGNA